MTPSFIMLLLTHQCNLDCKYCYLEDKSTIPDKEKVMSADTLRKVFVNIAENYVKNDDTNSINIQFAGGEPTLLGAKKIDEYYTIIEDILNAYGIPYTLCVITNGTTMNKELLSVFMKHKAGICVSVDGLTNLDRYSSEDELKNVVNTIKLIQDAGYSFNVHTVLTDKIKDTYSEECESFIEKYNLRRSVVVARDYKYKLSPSDEDTLKYYYFSELQRFIDGKIEDFKKFFTIGPGRFLLRYLTDRFTYHSDICRTSCGTKYCGGGINLAAITPDGYWQMCADFRGDEPFYSGRSYLATEKDFLNLRKIQLNLNYTVECLPTIRKCDQCIHQYYCDFPCMLYIRKKYGKWEIPDSYCKMMDEVYKWYENHMNSILKAIYKYSDTHSIKVLEDIVYQKIYSERLDSRYFYIDVDTKKDSPLNNSIIVRKR